MGPFPPQAGSAMLSGCWVTLSPPTSALPSLPSRSWGPW